MRMQPSGRCARINVSDVMPAFPCHGRLEQMTSACSPVTRNSASAGWPGWPDPTAWLHPAQAEGLCCTLSPQYCPSRRGGATVLSSWARRLDVHACWPAA